MNTELLLLFINLLWVNDYRFISIYTEDHYMKQVELRIFKAAY